MLRLLLLWSCMESLLLYVLLHNVRLSSAELLVLRQSGLEDSSLVGS